MLVTIRNFRQQFRKKIESKSLWLLRRPKNLFWISPPSNYCMKSIEKVYVLIVFHLLYFSLLIFQLFRLNVTLDWGSQHDLCTQCTKSAHTACNKTIHNTVVLDRNRNACYSQDFIHGKRSEANKGVPVTTTTAPFQILSLYLQHLIYIPHQPHITSANGN